MNVCSDLNCKNDCISWTSSNGQCYSNTITTTSTYAQYSDSSCNLIKPNTYVTPIILDNTCNLLYINGNQSPSGSYIGYNLSLVIGLSFTILILIILLIVWILYCCGVKLCCCKKQSNIPIPQNTIIIIDEKYLPPLQFNLIKQDIQQHYNYGYQINPPVEYNIPLYPLPPAPSAPPEYHFPPPPPLPSAPPADYNIKVI
jgi:hypothetical protein